MQQVHKGIGSMIHFYYRIKSDASFEDRASIQGVVLQKPTETGENWLISKYEIDKLKPFIYDEKDNPDGVVEFKKEIPHPQGRPTTSVQM